MPTMASRAGNLPSAFTSFLGRQYEVGKVCDLVRRARLLTLTGPAGVGKTRLALEAAAVAEGMFLDGAWLVDLAPVQEPAAIAGVAASALGMPEQGTRPIVAQLAGYLAARQALVVLDNCEHLAAAGAELVQTLLSAAPGLHVMVTSRHVLGLTGEHVFTVPLLSSEDAVGLLRDRAAAVRPGFGIDKADRAQAARLCADLDGLPLAIELAASRLRTFTVEQVADRLEDRFGLLTGGSPTAPPHRRTLRGAIGWSYELCDPAERLLWNRLSVFAGGFDLGGAEGVCAGDGIGKHEVLDLLDRLVSQSVVMIVETADTLRYRLLESIREYGREQLAASGEEETILGRHGAFFLTMAQRIDKNWYGAGQVEALARLRTEHANLLVALDRDVHPQARLKLAGALSWHWCVGGFLTEGRGQLDRALDAAPEPTADRARALLATVWVTLTQGDAVAAERRLDEADALAERLNDPTLRAQVSGFRGVSPAYRGQLKESICRYEGARDALAALGDERESTSWLLALACVRAYAGDVRAAETGREVIAVFEASGERWGRAQALVALAYHAWERGDWEAAKALARSALQSMWGFDDYPMVARMLELLAWATASGGDHEWTARLLGAASGLWKNIGTSIAAFGPHMAEHHARCERAVTAALSPGTYAQALAEGARHDSPGLAIPYALNPAHEPVLSAAGSGALTPREREVAALVAKGLSNRQIASTLVLSPRTADRHVQNILGKLGFGSRAQIASWWSASPLPTV